MIFRQWVNHNIIFIHTYANLPFSFRTGNSSSTIEKSLFLGTPSKADLTTNFFAITIAKILFSLKIQSRNVIVVKI